MRRRGCIMTRIEKRAAICRRIRHGPWSLRGSGMAWKLCRRLGRQACWPRARKLILNFKRRHPSKQISQLAPEMAGQFEQDGSGCTILPFLIPGKDVNRNTKERSHFVLPKTHVLPSPPDIQANDSIDLSRDSCGWSTFISKQNSSVGPMSKRPLENQHHLSHAENNRIFRTTNEGCIWYRESTVGCRRSSESCFIEVYLTFDWSQEPLIASNVNGRSSEASEMARPPIELSP